MYVSEVLLISVVALIMSLIFLYFLYKMNKLHKNKSLELFIQAAAGIFSIIFSSAVVLQVLSYNRERKVEVIKDYEELAKSFYNDTIEIFIDNDDMQYYFENLFHNKPLPHDSERNFAKERQMTYLIFSKLGTVTSYETIMEDDDKEVLDQWIAKILRNFLKSETFIQYWKEYKSTFGGKLSSQFMEEHFNL